MQKTLIVSYLPRGERSKTKQLLDTFLTETKDKTKIETLDLATNPPDMFLKENVLAYYKRDYGRQELSPEEASLLAKMDQMVEQLLKADIIVLAYPVYNFSLPAVVKAWFDAIMLKGHTWDSDANGVKGFLSGKKILIMYTSGLDYKKELGNENWDHSLTLGRIEFNFMGANDVEVVHARGMNVYPDEQKTEILDKAKSEIIQITKKWY